MNQQSQTNRRRSAHARQAKADRSHNDAGIDAGGIFRREKHEAGDCARRY